MRACPLGAWWLVRRTVAGVAMDGSGVRPSVTAEQRRSRYELSVLQHVMLLLRLESTPCLDSLRLGWMNGGHSMLSSTHQITRLDSYRLRHGQQQSGRSRIGRRQSGTRSRLTGAGGRHRIELVVGLVVAVRLRKVVINAEAAAHRIGAEDARRCRHTVAAALAVREPPWRRTQQTAVAATCNRSS